MEEKEFIGKKVTDEVLIWHLNTFGKSLKPCGETIKKRRFDNEKRQTKALIPLTFMYAK